MKYNNEYNIHGNFSIEDNTKQFILYLNGDRKRSFRCSGDGIHSCGCNVFHKKKDDSMVYICNSCETYWRCEK